MNQLIDDKDENSFCGGYTAVCKLCCSSFFYLRKLFSKFIKLQTVTDAGEGSDIASSPENKIFHVIPLQSAEKA